MPMVVLMNAIAQASAAPASGSKLDNRRVMAAIVDLLIVAAGAVVILVAGDSLSGDRPGALAAVIIGWALYYFFALESGEGQTLGKRLMKIRVVRADGRPAGMGEIAVRTILRVIDNYLIGMIVMIATGERRQRIGDLAAGTIVVDAAGPAVAAPPAAVLEDFEPVDHEVEDVVEVDLDVEDGIEVEDEVEDEVEVEDDVDVEVEDEDEVEAEADEPEADAAPDEDPVATQTITLPARPAPPETLADLTGPEPEIEAEPAVEEPVAEEPVVEEPVAEEPVVEEPVAEEPVVEEPVAEELPPVMSPALEELSEDVAAAHVEPEAVEPEAATEDSSPSGESDEPVNVKSVETVSAMDLIMGAAEENAPEQRDSESDQDAESPASA
jgi:uncharacterized RDD family membrane protein YckC